jgi:hypothetical protein
LARGQVEADSVLAEAPAGWRGLIVAVDAAGARLIS